VLQLLRDGRTALQDVPAREIGDSIGKLHDVCAATEAAATRIMDGIDRAQAMIEQLDNLAEQPTLNGEIEEATVRARLREELFAVIGSLQFQDITSQQLGHVSKMLGDVGRRIHASAQLLDGACGEAEMLAGEAHPVFAESASTRDVGERQAAADALFWAERVRKAAS
jgi:chemotaxis regulatin CheY-phosphate phosphatase CheZ